MKIIAISLNKSEPIFIPLDDLAADDFLMNSSLSDVIKFYTSRALLDGIAPDGVAFVFNEKPVELLQPKSEP